MNSLIAVNWPLHESFASYIFQHVYGFCVMSSFSVCRLLGKTVEAAATVSKSGNIRYESWAFKGRLTGAYLEKFIEVHLSYILHWPATLHWGTYRKRVAMMSDDN